MASNPWGSGSVSWTERMERAYDEIARRISILSRNDPTFGRPVDDVSQILAARNYVRPAVPMATPVTDVNAMLASRAFGGRSRSSGLRTLRFGTYLTGGSFDGTSDVTLATNATSANTASTLVARDASGNFSAGVITAKSGTTITDGTDASSSFFAGSGGNAPTAQRAATVYVAGPSSAGFKGTQQLIFRRHTTDGAGIYQSYNVTGVMSGDSDLAFGFAGGNAVASITTSGAVRCADYLRTGAPTTGSSGNWKLGVLVSAAVTPDTTRYLQVDVGGTLYKVIIST